MVATGIDATEDSCERVRGGLSHRRKSPGTSAAGKVQINKQTSPVGLPKGVVNSLGLAANWRELHWRAAAWPFLLLGLDGTSSAHP
jgi:hypothetical protein